MNKTIKISNRLKAVADFLPEAAFFADIGTDHAFLPSYVCLNDKNAKAIAGEVREGPYQAACKTIRQYNLSEQVELRLGDGLEVVQEDPVKQVVIAGMGGALMTKILEAGQTYLKTVERMIVQPNVDEKSVRQWFYQHGFLITEELILSENGHLYEIIVADKENKMTSQIPHKKNLLFGPVLLQSRPDLFFKKWQSEQRKLENILKSHQHAVQPDEKKLKELAEEIALIKEVLANE